jgi:hypothetical protein
MGDGMNVGGMVSRKVPGTLVQASFSPKGWTERLHCICGASSYTTQHAHAGSHAIMT